MDHSLPSLTASCIFEVMEEGAVVVAQLVEQSLSTPEVRSSNPFIGNIYIERFTVTFTERLLQRRTYRKEAKKGSF